MTSLLVEQVREMQMLEREVVMRLRRSNLLRRAWPLQVDSKERVLV